MNGFHPYARALRALMCTFALLLVACGDGGGGGTPDGGDETQCDPGALGCACAQGDVCATTANGEALACVEGVCASMTCPAGSTGCVCRGGTICDAEGDSCQRGACKSANCRAGEESCDCLGGACGAGLFCNVALGGGTCVDDTGHPGGRCPDNELCIGQNLCDRETDTCVHCSAGSQGCIAAPGGCNDGLVLAAGRCVPVTETRPADPQCHMECQPSSGLGEAHPDCGADGFIDGCIEGFACMDGSCVRFGDEPRACAADGECPSFQTCAEAEGRCYSNCEESDDCPSGLACDRHVCRVPCARPNSAADMCPSGTFCDMADGVTGVCMPLTAGDDAAAPATEVEAAFALEPSVLALTDVRRSGAVRFSTDGRRGATFTVTTLEHRTYDHSGAILEEKRRSDGEIPLAHLRLASGSTVAVNGVLSVRLPGGCGATCPSISIALAESMALPSSVVRWEGTIEVANPVLGVRIIHVGHSPGVEGRWEGTMHYFASFPANGLDDLRDPEDIPKTTNIYPDLVENGLIRRWGAFRNRAIKLDELRAVLDATSTGSWNYPSVRASCGASTGECSPACYLYDDGSLNPGPRTYVENRCDDPIPTGDTSYPIAIDIGAGALSENEEEYLMPARVDSSVALHYAGNPEITLGFLGTPTTRSLCQTNGHCIAPLTTFASTITIGGRTTQTPGTSCPTAQRLVGAGSEAVSYVSVGIPWLVPGFDADTTRSPVDGRLYRNECRDPRTPYVGQDALDANLTGGNPVPDGRAIRRRLSLLDGAMVDQETLVVLFEESFDSSLDPDDGFATYGYMLLNKRADVPTDASTPVVATRHDQPDPSELPRLGPVCDPDLVEEMFGASAATATPLEIAQAMIAGVAPNAGTPPTYLPHQIHYLCVDTGRFNGGSGDVGGANDVELACPIESSVRFFAFPADNIASGATRTAMLAGHACQANGSCRAVLEGWLGSNIAIDPDPVWACTDPAKVYCSDRRTDLRYGKTFYLPPSQAAPRRVFAPLESAVQDAFRYKTRFQSATARTLGFAPTLCPAGGGGNAPYCYDAEAIEEIQTRLDCLMSIYRTHGGPNIPAFAGVRAVLSASLSAQGTVGLPPGQLADGFEKLNAELLVMLGDEAYTAALSSRFDLAASNGATFIGSRFEIDGMDLTGLAGFEMHSLYQAVQYYSLAEERFYRVIAPIIEDALERGDTTEGETAGIISQALVTEYLERLIGGSTKKSRAWSEIARRYQGFHRPDLARRVIDRAYTSTYLESVIISQFVLETSLQVPTSAKPGILRLLEDAQRRYMLALEDMREVRSTITDDVNMFGYSVDEIPFPAVDEADTRFSNTFEAALGLARLRADTARRFEEDALTSGRAFDTDQASFQSELVRIGVTYESRLNELCGSFVGVDGQIHPATVKYASQSTLTSLHGDPCGTVGNGAIHEALVELLLVADDNRSLHLEMTNLERQMEDEHERVVERCALVGEIADFQFNRGSQVNSLNAEIGRMRTAVGALDRVTNVVLGIAGAENFSKLAALAAVGTSAAATGLEIAMQIDQERIASIELDTAHWVTSRQCDELKIESDHTMAALLRSAGELTLRADRLAHQFALEQSQIERLRLEAHRLEEEQRRAEQLLVDVEAARNDPNIRIYQNAAVLNADRSFQRALEHAYRATRMFEYFSSQSYPKLESLFLIRMVSKDYYNIDNYLDELEDDYEAFRSRYRTRANRVRRISMRDEVLRVPLSSRGGDTTLDSRVAAFREALTDERLLDRDGRLTIPFRTFRDQLSSCTFNHQINYIEVVFLGVPLGDVDAEVWIRQDGTGVIETASHEMDYYKLPAALIVARPHIGAADIHYDPSEYRQYEFRERPFINNAWSLVFDQRNNPDNQDVNLNNVQDIVIYVHYTDFTDPSSCR